MTTIQYPPEVAAELSRIEKLILGLILIGMIITILSAFLNNPYR